MNNPELEIYHRRLPHWRLDGSVYFVTWRLNVKQSELKPEEKDLVVSALHYFDLIRYDLYAYVVMDDHVHIIVKPKEDHTLQELVCSWKSFTAYKLQRDSGRKGSVW